MWLRLSAIIDDDNSAPFLLLRPWKPTKSASCPFLSPLSTTHVPQYRRKPELRSVPLGGRAVPTSHYTSPQLHPRALARAGTSWPLAAPPPPAASRTAPASG